MISDPNVVIRASGTIASASTGRRRDRARDVRKASMKALARGPDTTVYSTRRLALPPWRKPAPSASGQNRKPHNQGLRNVSTGRGCHASRLTAEAARDWGSGRFPAHPAPSGVRRRASLASASPLRPPLQQVSKRAVCLLGWRRLRRLHFRQRLFDLVYCRENLFDHSGLRDKSRAAVGSSTPFRRLGFTEPAMHSRRRGHHDRFGFSSTASIDTIARG
jgi:hypothetical protein